VRVVPRRHHCSGRLLARVPRKLADLGRYIDAPHLQPLVGRHVSASHAASPAFAQKLGNPLRTDLEHSSDFSAG
jgi:hypothetical protein